MRRPQRPRSFLERLVGWMLVGLGAATMFILTLTGYTDVGLFPGTHDVLYFMAGILAAAGGTWWLGLFDGDDLGRRPGARRKAAAAFAPRQGMGGTDLPPPSSHRD